MMFSYRTQKYQFICSIAEIILYHRYFSSKLNYPITGTRLLQCLCPSGYTLYNLRKTKVDSETVRLCLLIIVLHAQRHYEYYLQLIIKFPEHYS